MLYIRMLAIIKTNKMKKQLTIISIIFFLLSCSSTKQTTKNVKQIQKDTNTFLITEISDDKTYGLSPKNPVEVGGAKNSEGPRNERRYLNALAGPNGEAISYFRAGSCCPIKSDKALFGDAVMLDNYRVTWENSKDTVSIYINMYDSGKLKAPYGFALKK
ncbi:MAG: hypothetical protein ACI884_002200 [Ulvibacter sp.]|jgi:hypothetical protein